MHSLNRNFSPLFLRCFARHWRDGKGVEGCREEEGSRPLWGALLGIESQLCCSLTRGLGPAGGHL